MNRNTEKYLEHSKVSNIKKHRKQIRRATSIRHKRKYKIQRLSVKNKRYIIRQKRIKLLNDLHSSFTYTEKNRRVQIDGEFGIEDPVYFQSFLVFSSQCIDENSNKLYIDIKNCTRVWPSAITMLCSLTEWIEYSRKQNSCVDPKIASSDSNEPKVDYYLEHCGFYDFVKRKSKKIAIDVETAPVVKIVRETDYHSIPSKEDQIMDLLKSTTTYNKYDLELFDSIILSETFLNVQEHGVVCNDQGWWVLAQHHPSHKFISLNIADNGLGFRHNLMTGPQAGTIKNYIENKKENDGLFIKEALEKNVSGAFDAKVATSNIFTNQYERGARRGNGLKRIRDTCKKLGIKLTIISHYGYVRLDENSSIKDIGSTKNRIFGGTLYNYVIPAELENE